MPLRKRMRSGLEGTAKTLDHQGVLLLSEKASAAVEPLEELGCRTHCSKHHRPSLGSHSKSRSDVENSGQCH